MTTRSRKLPVALAVTLLLAACSGGGSQPQCRERPGVARRRERRAAAAPQRQPPDSRSRSGSRTATQDAQPQAACGAKVIKDEAEAADVGLTIKHLRAEPARRRRRPDPVGRRPATSTWTSRERRR